MKSFRYLTQKVKRFQTYSECEGNACLAEHWLVLFTSTFDGHFTVEPGHVPMFSLLYPTGHFSVIFFITMFCQGGLSMISATEVRVLINLSNHTHEIKFYNEEDGIIFIRLI